jgi:hypothetical protein
MSSESPSGASKLFGEIEAKFETTKVLDYDLVDSFIAELKKLENGHAAVKEFSWLFGLGEKDHHTVESKECRKVFLIDFKKCRKFLNNFITQKK